MSEDHERSHLLGDRDVDSSDAIIPIESTATGAADFSLLVDKNTIPEESSLGRHLSWQSAYILVISRVIGTGLFAAPGVVVQSTGSIGLSMVAWMIGAGFAACAVALSVEYGCMLPRSGGEKVYLEYTYPYPRYLATTIITVRAVLLHFTSSNCIVFAQYVFFAMDIKPTEWAQKSLAVGLLTVITIIHSCLPRSGVIIQNILGWIKIGLVLFMIFAGLFVVTFRKNSLEQSSSLNWSHLWEGSDWGWGVIATALFKVNYSFDGLDNANFILNEVQNPVKTLKSVSISAFWSVFFLYILSNIAYFMVVPIKDIKSSGELVAALFFERCFGSSVGKVLLPIAVALSAAGSIMVSIYSKGRLNQEIARQGFLPFSDFLASSRPFNAPMGGMIVQFIPSFLVIVLPPSKEAYSFILDVGMYPKQFILLALSMGLLWLRYKKPDLKRPFKAWISAMVLMIAVTLALIAAPFFPPKEHTGELFYATYALVGTSILLGGVLYWYVGFVLIPRRMGYEVEEASDVLQDGVTVTRLIKVPTKLNQVIPAPIELRN